MLTDYILLDIFGSGTPIPPASSYTYTLTLNELIEEALDVIGVGSEGEPITADMYRRGKRSLNLMVLSWNAQEDLWRHENRTVTPLTDTGAYSIVPKPMRVTSARRKLTLGGYETPMTEWSRQEYLDMPNKLSSPSTPVNFYYDPQRDTGVLYLWPAPSAAVAPTITVEIDVLRPFFILDLSNDTLDFPQEWQETVVMNLAKRLKLKYPVNDPTTNAQIDQLADELFAKLKAWDQEPASIYLQPDYRFEWR